MPQSFDAAILPMFTGKDLVLKKDIVCMSKAQCDQPCERHLVDWRYNPMNLAISFHPRRCEARCEKALSHPPGMPHECIRCQLNTCLANVGPEHQSSVANPDWLVHEIRRVRLMKFQDQIEKNVDASDDDEALAAATWTLRLHCLQWRPEDEAGAGGAGTQRRDWP